MKSFVHSTGTSSVVQDACGISHVRNHARRCDLLVPWDCLEFGLLPEEYDAIVEERYNE